MVVPLASYWSYPTIFEAIRPHLFVLTAEAFPHVYQWTTYPITSLLERIWEHFLPIIIKGGKPTPQVVELCSVLERALAYAHTSNGQLLKADSDDDEVEIVEVKTVKRARLHRYYNNHVFATL
ncbi:uncharacterized protein F5891DRAFT_979696 [Suillus fuscotomentosus]|uniref:Uncharacterized protein n=1 Tax=Suillus fuscotomentosus TaxID=1912939 RepID=A0AAD4E7N3_9AGAM|nr:uncharacterized protein F5891DRAFT_979696 [Suillus fuscotomentosus]KAG1901146.1 hypothetical protein F5891DRAFT_979696 [Suillus fuscotomentosus]